MRGMGIVSTDSVDRLERMTPQGKVTYALYDKEMVFLKSYPVLEEEHNKLMAWGLDRIDNYKLVGKVGTVALIFQEQG